MQNAGDIFFLTFQISGGAALFIFGLHYLGRGFSESAGNILRRTLSRSAGTRLRALGGGIVAGTFLHGDGGLKVFVGLVNAGLLGLASAVTAIAAAAIGMAACMQVFAFQPGDYTYVAVALGFIMQVASPWPPLRNIGTMLLGIGLMFLGITTTTIAFTMHPPPGILTTLTTPNLTLPAFTTILAAAAVMAWLVSGTGPVLALCYGFLGAGLFPGVQPVLPAVVGAHFGAALRGWRIAYGAHAGARRAAAAHLIFYAIAAGWTLAAARILLETSLHASADPLRQAAVLYALSLIPPALICILLAPACSRMLTRLLWPKEKTPEESHLDESLVAYPEKAIYAALRELHRIAGICAQSMRLNGDVILEHDALKIARIHLNELIVDEVKRAMRDFLALLTHRRLSRRQAVLIQHIDRCMVDLERMGDHITAVCDISAKRLHIPAAIVDEKTFETLYRLYLAARRVIEEVVVSLDPNQSEFQQMARKILEARDNYMQASIAAKSEFTEKIARRQFPPLAGIYLNEYVSSFDRLVKHAKSIALAEQQPQFWIKRRKLGKPAAETAPEAPPPRVDPHDFLDRLQTEDYL